MSTDSFHHQIEEGLRRRTFVEDFDDFQSVIEKKGTSLIMDFSDFKQYESKLNKSSKSCYPKLAAIKVVQFRKGSFKIFWKSDPIDVEYKEGNFCSRNSLRHGKLIETYSHQEVKIVVYKNRRRMILSKCFVL